MYIFPSIHLNIGLCSYIAKITQQRNKYDSNQNKNKQFRLTVTFYRS